MDLRTLRYCEAVVRLGSMTRAAEVLHVAQPALSVAIKKLEEELGVTLFARQRNRRVTVTPEGQILLKRVERLFQEVDSARRELADAVELRSGEVKIGLPPMYGLRYFPPLMTAFHSTYPGLTLTAIEGSAGKIGGLLDKGEIDLAILESRRVRTGWERVKVGEDEMALCVRRDHSLAGRNRVSGHDLDGLPMVVFDESFLQRNVLDKICHEAGAKFRVIVQSNFVSFVYHAAANGLGAATLLRSMVESDAQLIAVSFDPPEIFHFNLCWLDGRYLSKANKAFVDFAVQRYRSEVESGVYRATVGVG
jgi:LysR family cyn operon transcriptional activator